VHGTGQSLATVSVRAPYCHCTWHWAVSSNCISKGTVLPLCDYEVRCTLHCAYCASQYFLLVFYTSTSYYVVC